MAVSPLNLNDMLELKMHYDGERQKVLAQNIANKDVPGYKARDLTPLDFGNVMASQGGQLSLAVTSPKHMSGIEPGAQTFVNSKLKSTFDADITGNTISIEEQMMKVTQNAMDFQMSTTLYKKIGNLFKEALGLQPSP